MYSCLMQSSCDARCKTGVIHGVHTGVCYVVTGIWGWVTGLLAAQKIVGTRGSSLTNTTHSFGPGNPIPTLHGPGLFTILR